MTIGISAGMCVRLQQFLTDTPNLPTKIMDFRGPDSAIV